MLKEKQEAEKRQRVAKLKAKADEATQLKEKKIADATAKLKEQEEATEKKKKDDLKEKKKLRKEQERAVKGSESSGIMTELQEEQGMDVDTEEALLEAFKAVALQ